MAPSRAITSSPLNWRDEEKVDDETVNRPPTASASAYKQAEKPPRSERRLSQARMKCPVST